MLYITAKYHEDNRFFNHGFFLFSTEFSNHVIDKMLLKPCKFNVFDRISACEICAVLPDLKLVKETGYFQFTQMAKGGWLLGQHERPIL